MLNTMRSRFGGGARWLVMPAVLVSAGVALVSLAVGAGAAGAITLVSTSASVCGGPVAHSIPCRAAARHATAKLIPSTPVGTLPRIAKAMPGSPLTPAARANLAKLRTQLRAAMPGADFGIAPTAPSGT
jgi:hypothetical protein